MPGDVQEWIRRVFKECNAAATLKLANNPNVQEEYLDLSLIDKLTEYYSAPVRFDSGWIVELETHFIGGLPDHNWEIVDIGIMLFMREAGSAHVRKVVLLQSKRLYPAHTAIREISLVDYEIGIAAKAKGLGLKPRLQRIYMGYRLINEKSRA